MQIESQKTYRTDSLNQVSFILLHDGTELLKVQEDKFHHFYFILSNPPRCEELRQKFLNKASVPAVELFAKREMLLGEIKAQKEGKSYEK